MLLYDKLKAAPEHLQAFKRPDRCIKCYAKEPDNSVITCLPGEAPLEEGITFDDLDIMLIADHPVKADVDAGFNFINQWGQLLDVLLDNADVKKDRCYLGHAVKCAMHTKNMDNCCVVSCRGYLEKEIKSVKPKVIVTLGYAATHSVLTWSMENLKEAPQEIIEGVISLKENMLRNDNYTLRGKINQFSKGKKASKMFMSLESMRGNVFWSDEFGCYVVPTYHPSACFPGVTKGNSREESSAGARAECIIHDLQLASNIEELQRRVFNKQPVKYSVATTAKQVEDGMEFLCKQRVVAVDLETGGLDFTRDDILCASFSWGVGKALVVPITGEISKDAPEYAAAKKGLYAKCPEIWNPSEKVRVINALKKFLESNVYKVYQNGKFDNKFLRRYGIKVNNFVFDTMIAHHLINENLPHGLEFLTVWYTDMGRYDLELAYHKPNLGCNYSIIPSKVLYEYANRDAAATFRVFLKLHEEIRKDAKLYALFKNQQMMLSEALTDIEYNGVLIDMDAVDAADKELTAKIEVLERELVDKYTPLYNAASGTKDELNLKSNPQIALLLFDKNGLGLTSLKKTGKGAPCVDKDVLKELAKVHEFPEALLALRKLLKFKGTYVRGYKEDGTMTGMASYVDANNYLHTSFYTSLTVSGRLSSRNPNLQNLPAKDNLIRNFLIARPGYKFLEADYKAAEVRVLAYISGDEKLAERCEKGRDIHAETASDVFGIPLHVIEEKRAREEKVPERDIAKSILFGMIYGESAYSLAPKISKTVEECQEIIDKMFAMYPKMHALILKYHRLAKKGLPIVTPFGRKRRLHMNIYKDDTYYKSKINEMLRQAVNSPIQGTASDLTVRSIIRLWHLFRERSIDCRIVLTVHDSILFEFRDDPETLKQVHALIDRVMVYNFPGSTVKFYIDKHESYKWEKVA